MASSKSPFFLWASISSSVKWESESESCLVISDSLWPHGLYSWWNALGQNTGVDSLSLLQQIFPTQELNWGLLCCRQILYQLNYKGGWPKSKIHSNWHSVILSDLWPAPCSEDWNFHVELEEVRAPQVVLAVKILPANAGRHNRLGFDPWIGKISWRRAWQPTPVFLPGESHAQRSLVGCGP